MDLASVLCGVRDASRSPAALVSKASGVSLTATVRSRGFGIEACS